MVLVFMFGCVVLLVHIGSLFKIICWLNLAQFAQFFSARECISVHPDMQWALCLFLICNGLGCPVWAMVRVDLTDNGFGEDVPSTHTLYAFGEDGSLLGTVETISPEPIRTLAMRPHPQPGAGSSSSGAAHTDLPPDGQAPVFWYAQYHHVHTSDDFLLGGPHHPHEAGPTFHMAVDPSLPVSYQPSPIETRPCHLCSRPLNRGDELGTAYFPVSGPQQTYHASNGSMTVT